MRISFLIFMLFISIFVKAESLSFLQILKIPTENVKLEDYLKLTDRDPVNDLDSVMRSVRITNSMEKLNIKNLESKSNSDKIQNIKSRINFLSKPMGVVKLSIAETFLCLVFLQKYYDLSLNIKDEELNNLIHKNKAGLVARKQKIFELMLNHDFELFRSIYDEMTGLNEKPTHKKNDSKNLTPDEIQKGIVELEKMKDVVNNNLKCLSDSSCHLCGLSVSPKSCSTELKGRANKILMEKIDSTIPHFNRSFEKLIK